MYYVYILRYYSTATNIKYYIGCTQDLKKRISQHVKGDVKTTKNKNPELIYYEAYVNKYVAFQRERGLKNSGSVYNALFKRLQLK